MKKLYFKFLFIAFSSIMLTITIVFYFGYLKREKIRKERLKLIEIKEIYSVLEENYPFNNDTIPLIREVEKNYNVILSINTRDGFDYSGIDKKKLKQYCLKLIPVKRKKKNKRPLLFLPRFKKSFLPELKGRFTYFLDRKARVLRGVSIKNNRFEVLILKKSDEGFTIAFFVLIAIIFSLFGSIFSLIRKWYVNPLVKLEEAIKSIENNLNSPELYRDSSDTLTPVFNALNDLKRRIIHEINSKEEMLRDISHDLKTPLSRIKLALEFIENGKIKKSINEDVKELEELISKILDIYAVKQEDCKCSLKDFLDKMVNKYSNIDFIVDCDKDVIVPVCEEDLKRIFYNLVENSVKFADVSKGIFIKAEIKNNIIEIRYKDCETKGNKPDLDRIFDYFYKSDKARNKNINKGFGLGLSIVKKLCESYGGKISAEFSDCNGIEFLIQFPVNN